MPPKLERGSWCPTHIVIRGDLQSRPRLPQVTEVEPSAMCHLYYRTVSSIITAAGDCTHTVLSHSKQYNHSCKRLHPHAVKISGTCLISRLASPILKPQRYLPAPILPHPHVEGVSPNKHPPDGEAESERSIQSLGVTPISDQAHRLA